VKVGYERYGMQSDLEYFEEQMLLDKDHFEIIELNWVATASSPRTTACSACSRTSCKSASTWPMVCVRQVPALARRASRCSSPTSTPLTKPEPYETANQKRAREVGQGFRIFNPTRRKDHEGNAYSLNKGFLEEYLTYPFSPKKDLIDAAAASTTWSRSRRSSSTSASWNPQLLLMGADHDHP
jgi:hypothetical protein